MSAIVESLIGSRLKTYLSEKTGMERLKKSIIRKSGLIVPKISTFESEKSKIQKIYKFALNNRGGQLEEFQDFDRAAKMAQHIQRVVERLAIFFKRRKSKGMSKFLFRSARLVLKRVLCKCNIIFANSFNKIEMGAINLDQSSILKPDFSIECKEKLDKLMEEFRLSNILTNEEISNMIKNKVRKKLQARVAYFQDIRNVCDNFEPELNIIDAKIIEKIRVK